VLEELAAHVVGLSVIVARGVCDPDIHRVSYIRVLLTQKSLHLLCDDGVLTFESEQSLGVLVIFPDGWSVVRNVEIGAWHVLQNGLSRLIYRSGYRLVVHITFQNLAAAG
jgi:hypothetical protein